MASSTRRWSAHAPRILALIGVVLILSAGALAQPADEGTATPEARLVLTVVGEAPHHTTVLQRIEVDDATRRNVTLQVAVPERAAQHEVKARDGETLTWAETRPGVLTVSPTADTQAVIITTRGAHGPELGKPLRFGDDPASGAVWLIVAMPAGSETRPAGLDAVTREVVTTQMPILSTWPIPSDAALYWNAGNDQMIPAQIEVHRTDAGATVPPYAVALAIAALLVGLTLWLVIRIHKNADDPTRARSQPIMGHLEELRRRLTLVIAVLVAAMVFFFSFGFRWTPIAGTHMPVPWPSLYDNAAAQAFHWISAQIVPAGVELVVVSPWDAVVTLLLLSAAMGAIATFPILFYQSYAFLAPALYPRERRLVLALVPIIITLLILGAGFGITLIAPLIAKILYGFATGVGATALLTTTQLVGLAALMGILFALAFQLPLIMTATARMGIIRAAAYRRKWRHALIIIVIISAMVTDPTVITQLIVAAVLLALYGIGLVLATLADRERTGQAE